MFPMTESKDCTDILIFFFCFVKCKSPTPLRAVTADYITTNTNSTSTTTVDVTTSAFDSRFARGGPAFVYFPPSYNSL